MGASRRGKDWTEDEVIQALNLYKAAGKIPDKSDSRIMALASSLGRTPAAVAYKIGNLRYLETSGRHGFAHCGATDRVVWERYGTKNGLTLKASPLGRKLSRV